MRKTIVNIISTLLVILWTYAAISKLLDYKTFVFQLGRSPYITGMANTVAWLLPLGELSVTALLIMKPARLIGLYASFFLMLLFTGYIYIMLHYSYYVPCSCGGILSHMSWDQHFIFNTCFTLLALLAIVLYRKEEDDPVKNISGNIGRPRPVRDV